MLQDLATPAGRAQLLCEPLFDAWSTKNGPLPSTHVLLPVPVLPFGGSMEAETLSPAPLAVALAFLEQVHLND